MNPRQMLESAFPSPLMEAGLFYRQPGGLRFELSEGGGCIAQFQQAMDKARVLCGALFPQDESMVVCLRLLVRDSGFSSRSALRALRQAGVRWPRQRSFWIENLSAEALADEAVADEEVADEALGEKRAPARWCMLAFPATADDLWPLLWCALSVDFPVIRPNPGCEVHLFNLSRRLHVHPYDDRGMDVVGADHALLAELYQRHHRWLLAYDLEAMERAFASPGARL